MNRIFSRAYCDEIVTVSDVEIKSAVASAFENGLVVEPSGAAALAAVIHEKVKPKEKEENIVIVLTGGNISPTDMSNLLH